MDKHTADRRPERAILPDEQQRVEQQILAPLDDVLPLFEEAHGLMPLDGEELAIEVRPCPIGYQAVATNRYDGAPDGDRRVGYGATPAEAEAVLRELYDC